MASRGARVAVVLLAMGCTQDEVRIRGKVTRSREDKSPPLVDGLVTLRDADGQVYAQAVTDSNGDFRVEAPAGETVYLVTEGVGLVPASFAGVSGLQPTLRVERGTFYGFDEPELSEWELLFDGCPGVGEGGGIAVGEVRTLRAADTEDHPLVTTAWAYLESEEQVVYEACYLDDAGQYDPEAELTGDTGVFAIFGVPQGTYSLVVGYHPFQEYSIIGYTSAWVPDGGVVPQFPAWVEWPL